jgi:hypothetical protein
LKRLTQKLVSADFPYSVHNTHIKVNIFASLHLCITIWYCFQSSFDINQPDYIIGCGFCDEP